MRLQVNAVENFSLVHQIGQSANTFDLSYFLARFFTLGLADLFENGSQTRQPGRIDDALENREPLFIELPDTLFAESRGLEAELDQAWIHAVAHHVTPLRSGPLFVKRLVAGNGLLVQFDTQPWSIGNVGHAISHERFLQQAVFVDEVAT